MKNILVVDDEDCLVDMLCEYLNIKGYTAFGTVSPLEAVHELKKNKYDVVITDYNMPEMDGLELSIEIAKMKSPPKVIMLTGNSNVAKLRSNKSLHRVFTKPMNYLELITEINDI